MIVMCFQGYCKPGLNRGSGVVLFEFLNSGLGLVYTNQGLRSIDRDLY